MGTSKQRMSEKAVAKSTPACNISLIISHTKKNQPPLHLSLQPHFFWSIFTLLTQLSQIYPTVNVFPVLTVIVRSFIRLFFMYELLFVCRSRLVDVESEWGGTTRISLKTERADLKYIMHSKLLLSFISPPVNFLSPKRLLK